MDSNREGVIPTMSDLTQKNKIGIKSGGLHARIAEGELLKTITPSEALNVNTLPNRIALMIDTSGSMYGESIKLLENAVQDFVQKSNPSDTAIAIESFPRQVRIEPTNDKQKLWLLTMGLEANGGTPMCEAMGYCSANYNLTRAILISDGQPDKSPKDSALSYKNQGVAIDTVHIGNSTDGEAILKEVSEITGGLFVKFKDVKQFATAFSFLLPEHRDNAATLLLGSGANEVR
jgi:Mg-chelatase subunit ChlD